MVNKDEMSKWLTIPQAAKVLGVSRITVYKRVKAGKIKAEKVGRSYLIHVSELDIKQLDEAGREQIREALGKVISQYGDVLKRLSKE